MGEIADSMIDRMIFGKPPRRNRISYEMKLFMEKKWTTKNGKEILIADMDTGHIKNCIRMCRRKGFEERYIYLFEEELKRREG